MIYFFNHHITMKKVSIIVPTYNNEKYIVDCLESICNQTHPCLDIIVVDDGSTDNTGNICDKFADKDKRIKVIHTANRGVSSARNTGLDASTGEYIMFVDGDDWIEKNAVEYLLQTLETTKSDLCFSVKIFRNDSIQEHGDTLPAKSVYKSTALLQEHLNCTFGLSVCMILVRSSICKRVRFDETIFNLEDWDFNSQLLKNAATVTVVDYAFYHYRKTSGSASNSPLNLKKISCFKIMDKLGIAQNSKYQNKLYLDIFIFNLAYNMMSIYSVHGGADDSYKIVEKFCRKHCLHLFRSKHIKLKQKLYILIAGCSMKLYRFLFKLKNGI